MSARGPLAGRYPPAVVLVVFALVPYLALTTAFNAVQDLIGADIGMGARGLTLTTAMANAAYSFGAVAAVQFGTRLRPRRMLVLYATGFVVASVFTAWAPTRGFFVAGHVLQGLTTGLMLIAAVPPLITSFGVREVPRTAVVMDLGLFGAVALGPVVGGASAGAGDWRVMFWIIAGLGLVALVFAVLTYEDDPPADPEAPWDVVALLGSALGTGLLFFGVAELDGRHGYDLLVLGPVLAGLAVILGVLVHEYRTPDPLIPIRGLFHTLPAAAIVTALAAGASSVVLIQLTQEALTVKGTSPNHAGMLFWPLVGAALLAALVFGRVLLTGFGPVMAFAGLILLGGGGAVLTGAARGSDALVLVGSGLVGFGVGSSVAPAMFSAGFSMPSPILPRVFAMIELLRGVAAFLVAPAVLVLAQTVFSSEATGLRTGTWIAVGIALGGALLAGAIYGLGGARPSRPDAEPWLAGETTAVGSPLLFQRVRDPGRVAEIEHPAAQVDA